jgi:hypothetical protein
MANSLYDSGKNGFLTGGIDWVNDTIKVILVNISTGSDYVVDLANHANLANVAAGVRVSDGITIANRTAVAGVADGDNLNLTNVTALISTTALVIYKDTGVEATSTLVAYIDSATGLTTQTDGSDVAVTWDSGANKIIKI